MKLDSLGRKQADRVTDVYGACRCCGRWFVKEVTDRTTEARHERDGYCGGCAGNATRNGTERPTCTHNFPGSSYRCGFTPEVNALHTIRFLNRIRTPHHRKDPHMEIRADLLNDYMATRSGQFIGDHFGVESPALGEDYLRYLTGNTDLHIPGDAIHWAPLTEDPAIAVSMLYRIADWTATRRGRHAHTVAPQPGDLVIFEGSPADPFGTMGIYLSHTYTTSRVFTQGHQDRVMPAQEYDIHTSRQRPVGWWRVREELILEHHDRKDVSA